MDQGEAKARIHDLLVTGDNRLKQGVRVDKIRTVWEEALALAVEHGLEEQVRPLVRSEGDAPATLFLTGGAGPARAIVASGPFRPDGKSRTS